MAKYFTEQRGAVFPFQAQDTAGAAVNTSTLTPLITEAMVKLKLPGETVFTDYLAGFTSTGTDGKHEFVTTLTTHLGTTAGSAQWQGKIVLGSKDYLTDVVDFEIHQAAQTS